MNAEEFRHTTLDPNNRTLLQITMQDAGTADDLFRILMGDKVEPRREFIETHALERESGRVSPESREAYDIAHRSTEFQVSAIYSPRACSVPCACRS